MYVSSIASVHFGLVIQNVGLIILSLAKHCLVNLLSSIKMSLPLKTDGDT